MRPLPLAAAFVATLFLPRPSAAQLIPPSGPSNEQMEFANVILLAPEAGLLGAFVVGGGAFLVTRECCTEKGDDVPIEPVAVGAAIGSAIGVTWATWSIGDAYHPGSRTYAAVGAALGSGIGAGVFFGGPEVEEGSDQVLRFVTFLFLPALAAYGGWHLDPDGFYMARVAPEPAWAAYAGPAEGGAGRAMTGASFRF